MQQQALFFALVLARVSAFVAVMPLFSTANVPRLVRAGLALSLSVFWFCQLAPPPETERMAQDGEVPWLLFSLAVGREVLLGSVVALLFAMFLTPVHVAGEFIGSQIGLAQTSLIGGASNAPASPLTILLESLAGMVFLAIDGHHVVLAILHASFARHPLGGTFMPVPAEAAVECVSTATSLGLLLGGPLALALFVLNVVLALMGRVAPQLNVYSVGFSLQAIVALAAAALLLPDLIAFMAIAFGRIGEMVRVMI
jgi:flagellar biosynthetic protein FliR